MDDAGNDDQALRDGAFTPKSPRAAADVFLAALGLGLTSFGGPIAHIGYFERAYVQHRKWLTAEEFAGLVALCQLVPGPASSQLGYLIGLKRAGWTGAFAAWAGFTLPSALVMFAFALFARRLSSPLAAACLHGFKLVAVAIVAQAVWSMARTLCPDTIRKFMAVAAGAVLLVSGRPGLQIVILLAGAPLGALLCRHMPPKVHAPLPLVGPRLGTVAFVLFLAPFPALLVMRGGDHSVLAMASIFYRSGALVFGGHVVLPLLRAGLVPSGWLTDNAFLSGYGAAQALPGPLFTVAAYLGATAAPLHSGVATTALWSATALCAVFLPGMLVAIAGLSVWNGLSRHEAARGAFAGVNAAVVGVLGAAFCTPIWPGAVFGLSDFAMAAFAFILLVRFRMPPVAIVAVCLAAAVIQSAYGLV